MLIGHVIAPLRHAATSSAMMARDEVELDAADQTTISAPTLSTEM
jgi:hypothetical protein